MEGGRLYINHHHHDRRERHKLAPSNRPPGCLFARPMRVQIVLGARLHPARFANGRRPVPFRDEGLRGRRDGRWPGAVARGDICIHVGVSTNAHRLCRVLLAFLFELPVWRRRRHRRVRHEHVVCMRPEAVSGQIMIRARCQSKKIACRFFLFRWHCAHTCHALNVRTATSTDRWPGFQARISCAPCPGHMCASGEPLGAPATRQLGRELRTLCVFPM